MNEVFLDTETTGLSFKEGHKIVEVACIETKDLIPTGNIFHRLINQKDVPDEAFVSWISKILTIRKYLKILLKILISLEIKNNYSVKYFDLSFKWQLEQSKN